MPYQAVESSGCFCLSTNPVEICLAFSQARGDCSQLLWPILTDGVMITIAELQSGMQSNVHASAAAVDT